MDSKVEDMNDDQHSDPSQGLAHQKAMGKRIHQLAKLNGFKNLPLLYQAMSELREIHMSEANFLLVLGGLRASPQFAQILDAAVEVIAQAEDNRLRKQAPSEPEEIQLRKREIRSEILEGQDKYQEYELHDLEARIIEPTVKAIVSNAKKSGWQFFQGDWGRGLTHPEFNRKLILRKPKIETQKSPKEWLARDYWHPDVTGFTVRAAKQSSPKTHNERKIRISSDFLDTTSVAIQPTWYYSSLATDQIAWKRFQTTKSSPDGLPTNVLWDGVDAFVDSRGALKSFQQSRVSNQLGASVMAFTADGEMLVVHQNKDNQQSKNKLAPSGSGSLDWDDVGNRSDFLEIVRFGAKRELDEECALVDPKKKHQDIACEIMLTAFVRMLHRAGKPEFFGIARIEGNSDEICRRKPEQYVEKVFAAQITRADWSLPASPQIARMCHEYLTTQYSFAGKHVPLSYPLQHLLEHLIDVCKDSKTAGVINKFMAR